MSGYLVNCMYEQDRDANYERRSQLRELFEPCGTRKPPQSICGNVGSELRCNPETRLWRFHVATLDTLEFSGCLYSVIPSALLLYRLLCTFGAVVLMCEGGDGYKCVWEYGVTHKATSEYVMFGEWKGGACLFTRFSSSKDMPQSLRDDLLSLLNYLVSDECGHPYDGVVAGSVA